MAHVRWLFAVEADIEQVLAFTLRRFGSRKYDEYGSLILEALQTLEVDPQAGKRRPESLSKHGPTTSPSQEGAHATCSSTGFRGPISSRCLRSRTTAWTCPGCGVFARARSRVPASSTRCEEAGRLQNRLHEPGRRRGKSVDWRGLHARPKAPRLSNLSNERRAAAPCYERPLAKVRNLSRLWIRRGGSCTAPLELPQAETVRGYLRETRPQPQRPLCARGDPAVVRPMSEPGEEHSTGLGPLNGLARGSASQPFRRSGTSSHPVGFATLRSLGRVTPEVLSPFKLRRALPAQRSSRWR